MVKYNILNTKNEDYNPGLLQRLCLLYKGGYAVTRNADLFLSQLASETAVSFEDRKKCCSYLPFMSDTIDHYTAMLFSQELSVSESGDADDASTLGDESEDESVYKLFLAAADGKGNSLEEVIRKVMTDAMIHNKSFIGVDFPMADELPINLLEEEVMQTGRPYVYYLDPECVVDWSMDDNDNYNWIKIKSDIVLQPNPLVLPKHVIEFKIWTVDGPDNTAKWQLYRSKELLMTRKEPGQQDELELVDEGTTSFKQIPILKLCLPEGLALGCKIAPICEDIFQRTSILVNNENRSLNAMRVVYLDGDPSAGAKMQPSLSVDNPFRHMMMQDDWESKGVAVLQAGDKLEVVESEGHAFEIVSKQINELIEKLKEVVHQMANTASSQTKALGRSAASKQQDRHATEVILSAYGNIIRDFVKRLMACISTAREESIVWTVDGLENFNIVDRDQLILEMAQFAPFLQANQGKSPTFEKLYSEKMFLQILDGTSHEEALVIRQEIMDADFSAMPDDPAMQPKQLPAPASDPAETTTLGPSGQALQPEGSHLQTGQHIDGSIVFDQLAEDYNEKDIEWVKHISWIGPVEVPLSSIDFSNKDNWQASQDPDQVDKFADKMQDGFDKPAILVNNPSNDNKMMVIDGHHRSLAAQQNNQPVNAYVGQIGSNHGPWEKLHSKQVGSQQEKSNQMTEASVQKGASKQSNKSAMTKNGKTK